VKVGNYHQQIEIEILTNKCIWHAVKLWRWEGFSII